LLIFSCVVYIKTSYIFSLIIIHIFNSYTGFYPVYGTICFFVFFKHENVFQRITNLMSGCYYRWLINPLNAELNPICHLLALLGAHHILHVSRIRVKYAPTDNYILLVVKALLIDWQINGFTYNKILLQAEINIFQ